jgi:hypothetical protein
VTRIRGAAAPPTLRDARIMKFFAGNAFFDGGFRTAAECFFGDQPKAVQMGEQDIKFFCATEGGVP